MGGDFTITNGGRILVCSWPDREKGNGGGPDRNRPQEKDWSDQWRGTSRPLDVSRARCTMEMPRRERTSTLRVTLGDHAQARPAHAG